MNNDLISRSELKKTIKSYDKFGYTANRELIRLDDGNIDKFVPYVKFDDVCNCIDNTPTIDINTELSVTYLKGRRQGQSDERATGEWIRTGSLGNGNAQYECSNCHYGDEHAESQEVPYCWHCGAKMGRSDKE